MLLNSCAKPDLCRLALVAKLQQNRGFGMAKFEIERGIELTTKEPMSFPNPLERGPGGGRASRSGLRALFRDPMGNGLITY